jgi:hypothetical protein
MIVDSERFENWLDDALEAQYGHEPFDGGLV